MTENWTELCTLTLDDLLINLAKIRNCWIPFLSIKQHLVGVLLASVTIANMAAQYANALV